MLSLASPFPGSQVDVGRLQLVARGQSVNLLRNADFSQGRAHWFELTQRHYLPWHTDNLYLELLMEQGLLGLTTGLAGWAVAWWMLVRRPGSGGSFGPFLASSIAGVCVVGAVSSVLDAPRIGFLFFFLVLLAAALARPDRVPRTAGPGHPLPALDERPA